MRPLPLLPILLVALQAWAAPPAFAQVSVNSQALDSLGQSSGSTTHHAPPAHRPAPARKPPPHHPAPAAKQPERAATPVPATPSKPPAAPRSTPSHATPPAAVQNPPTIPAGPPPNAAIAPAIPAPNPHPAAPPPPVPVVNTAQGETATINGGVRITFGAGSADLNPATMAAVQKFAALVKDQPIGIDVIASATGAPEDPSTPRRLSLSRALAVRAVLINEGIPSTRIYPRALGPNAGDGPPDRVDLVEHKVTQAPDTEPKQ